MRSGILPVDLIDDNDRLEIQLERFFQDKLCPGKGSFSSINEKQYAVDHLESSFYFTGEVGVPGRVDDVDFEGLTACRVLIEHCGILREDGDAALALELVRVHDAFDDFLVLAEGASLAKHIIHQRRLAVIDVSDDGDVADVVSSFHRKILCNC